MSFTYQPIATTTLTSSQASININSIPAGYTDLVLIIANLRSVGGAATLRVQYNADTGGNYYWTRLRGDGSTATTQRGTAAGWIDIFDGQELSTTVPSFVKINIFGYRSSVVKSALAEAHFDRNTSGSLMYLSTLWNNTPAITQITLSTNGNSIATGTTVTLYGILKV